MPPLRLAWMSIGLLVGCSCGPAGPSPMGQTAGTAGRADPRKPLVMTAQDDEEGVAGAPSFSLYLLALSWAPNFCCGHEGRSQCDGLGGSFGADHLTIHGLWPNYSDAESARAGADYPVYCGRFSACRGDGGPSFCRPDPATIPPGMSKYGPGYVTDDDFLANHEWPKHGSCSGLEPGAFFAAAIKSLLALPGDSGTPELLRHRAGGDVALAELRDSFGAPASVVLSCDQDCNLKQVGICLAHDAGGSPTAPVACPGKVTASDYDNGCVTHRCGRIRIQKAGQCAASPR